MSDPAMPEEVRLFLSGLADRVRAARTKTGLSRRLIAARAGMSERYLAEIERGQGNVSVLNLWRLARALGQPVANLLDEPALPVERIAFIGLRGAGKSTLGRMTATALGLPFHELNIEIETISGLAVAELIALYGQEGYRRLERQALERITGQEVPLVLAVAGGIVEDTRAFEHLLANYRTIWLRARPEEHMDRVRAQGDERPMAGNPAAMTALRSILTRRETDYARADLTIDTSGLTPEEVLRDVILRLGPAEKRRASG